MIRSSLSISSNIAEGAERGSDPDFIRFLHYAKGSAAELRSQAMIAAEVGIIPCDDRERVCIEATELSRMLQGLINSLAQKS
jgi:four helix bundle protein